MTKEKIKAIAKRALWTFLQAFLAIFISKVPEGSSISSVNWGDIFGIAVTAGLLSVAKSALIGLPEIKEEAKNDIFE